MFVLKLKKLQFTWGGTGLLINLLVETSMTKKICLIKNMYKL